MEQNRLNVCCVHISDQLHISSPNNLIMSESSHAKKITNINSKDLNKFVSNFGNLERHHQESL